MFDKQWFLKCQKNLLWVLNTPIVRLWFRWVLRVNGGHSNVGRRKIIGILPNAIFWKGQKKNQIVAEFRTHNKFSKRLYYVFKPLWYLFHTWDTFFANNWKPQWNLGFDTTGDLFPAAGANSPVDGEVSRGPASETFTTIRDGAGTVFSNIHERNTTPILIASTTTDQFTLLGRNIYCWDTSAIGGGKTIDSVVLSIDSSAKSTGLGSPDHDIVSATPASNSTLAAADYGQLGASAFATIVNASWVTTGYNDHTLNQAGRDNINATGISRYGSRLSWDTSGTFGGTWSSGLNSYFDSTFADTVGTADDPKLVVTYTPAVNIAAFQPGTNQPIFSRPEVIPY